MRKAPASGVDRDTPDVSRSWRVLEKAFANTIKAIELRNGAARQAGASRAS
ncbi:hypothetical protein WN982_31465 [Paraburkholderia sp. IMGN_8]|uniref:hypothetical protein n=1 Tax=Paraburkholderia sp. IMGN_8 TaxID=3136564 RepID=UPI003100D9CB